MPHELHTVDIPAWHYQNIQNIEGNPYSQLGLKEKAQQRQMIHDCVLLSLKS